MSIRLFKSKESQWKRKLTIFLTSLLVIGFFTPLATIHFAYMAPYNGSLNIIELVNTGYTFIIMYGFIAIMVGIVLNVGLNLLPSMKTPPALLRERLKAFGTVLLIYFALFFYSALLDLPTFMSVFFHIFILPIMSIKELILRTVSLEKSWMHIIKGYATKDFSECLLLKTCYLSHLLSIFLGGLCWAWDLISSVTSMIVSIFSAAFGGDNWRKILLDGMKKNGINSVISLVIISLLERVVYWGERMEGLFDPRNKLSVMIFTVLPPVLVWIIFKFIPSIIGSAFSCVLGRTVSEETKQI